jgi:cytochrome c
MTIFSRGMMAILAAAFMVASGAAWAGGGDAARGKKVYNKCKACHATKAGKNRVGPSLFDIVGKKAAGVPKYKYSSAMKKSGLTWDEATLDKYLKKPKGLVKRTKMTFAGLKKQKDRDDVIAYIKTLK